MHVNSEYDRTKIHPFYPLSVPVDGKVMTIHVFEKQTITKKQRFVSATKTTHFVDSGSSAEHFRLLEGVLYTEYY